MLTHSTGDGGKDTLPMATEMTVYWAAGDRHSRQGRGPQALGGTDPRKGCTACQAGVMEQSGGTRWPRAPFPKAMWGSVSATTPTWTAVPGAASGAQELTSHRGGPLPPASEE